MTQENITDLLKEAADGETDVTVVTASPSGADSDAIVALVPEEVEAELAKDTLFELLKNQRRRDALTYLRTNDGWATLSDLAEDIAAKENDTTVEALNSKQRKRVYIGLYQCHLPKMATAGVVDFDKNRGTIELTDLAAQLYPYLEDEPTATGAAGDIAETNSAGAADETMTEQAERGVTPESSVVTGLGVAALAGVAGVPGFEIISATMWAVVCAAALVVVGLLPFVRD